MKTIRIIILAIALIGATSQVNGSSRNREAEHRSFDVDLSTIILPGKVGAFTKIEHRILREHKDLLARYSRSAFNSSRFDVFVYPVYLPKGVSLADINETEMRCILKGLQAVYPGSKATELDSFSGQLNAKRYEAIKAKLEIPGKQLMSSWVYLSVIDDVFVKVRYTEPTENEYESQVDGFVASLLTRFSFSDPQAHKHPLAPVVGLSSTDFDQDNAYLSALMAYAAILSIEVENGRFLDTYERAQACWEPTLTIWQGLKGESSQNAVGSAFDGMLSARKAGYFREYLWVNFQKPYWIQPSGLRLEKFRIWASQNLKGHVACDTKCLLVVWR